MQRIHNFIKQKFGGNIRAIHKLPAREAELCPFPEQVCPDLRAALEEQGIASLYSHQAASFAEIGAGRDCLLVSQTASGKTLSFLLPILNEYAQSPAPFSVLFIYPTKALSRDQEATLGSLLKASGLGSSLGTYDGDTPREERAGIARGSDFILSNPDMLHSGIIPNHSRRWRAFLSRLKFVVVDEVHMYRGAFGSHFSNVLKRLLRVCELYGSRPTFVCSSATIGNPEEHVRALFGRDFSVISEDGAPRPQRQLYMLNPSLVKSQGHALYRKGVGSISVPLIKEAAKAGVRTICFCRGRQEVERVYKAAVDREPALAERIKPYRGGLLPNERRKLERDLLEGRLTVVITTNALELGIDVGSLDLCVVSGHPGSLASFWQQAGRVGRKGRQAAIVYIAKDSPIDQFLVHHPKFVLNAPIERAWLSPNNPYIFLQHLPCAAHEHPLRDQEPLFENRVYSLAKSQLLKEKTIVPYREFQRYALEDYPTRGVNIRGMTDYNVEIYLGTQVIGELDPIGARGTLYKDAIYQHLGQKYMSMELDLEKKLCRVEKVDVDYYTDAVWEKRIWMEEVEDSKNLSRASFEFGGLRVNKQPKLYKKIRERSFENIGYGPITLEPFIYDTMGFRFRAPDVWQREMEQLDRRYISAGIYGLSYILGKIAPSLCMGDTKDIECDVSLACDSENEWKNALYLYDTLEGGVGYAEKVYELIEQVFKVCRQVISECECDSGCPSCIPPLPPGVPDEELETFFSESDAALKCCSSLLDYLIEQKLTRPEVEIFREALVNKVAQLKTDPETELLNRRLEKAAEILKKKRARAY